MYQNVVILQKYLQFIIKSGFKSRAGYNGAGTVCKFYVLIMCLLIILVNNDFAHADLVLVDFSQTKIKHDPSTRCT